MRYHSSPALIFALLLSVATSRAHGPVSESIAAVTAELVREPNRADLLLSRARFHAQHEDWPAAHADLDRAEILAPGLTNTALLRGEVFLMVADFKKAHAAFTQLIAAEPRMPLAHEGLARTLFASGEFALAAQAFGRSVEFSEQPAPILYNNQSSAFEKAGKPAEALAALDAGIARIGPLVSLVTPAIEMDIAAKRFDAAIARVDSVLASLPRKETWLVRRAEILEKAGRNPEARATWEQARAAFATLPEFRQSTLQMSQLRTRIEAALSR